MCLLGVVLHPFFTVMRVTCEGSGRVKGRARLRHCRVASAICRLAIDTCTVRYLTAEGKRSLLRLCSVARLGIKACLPEPRHSLCPAVSLPGIVQMESAAHILALSLHFIGS